jgi:hypothetical protein
MACAEKTVLAKADEADALNARYRRILLKNSHFGLDHNSEDRWQPKWKFP